MLVILDANVFVSAAITPTGIARTVVEAGIQGRFEYAVCPSLLNEVADVLTRSKISQFLPPGVGQRFLADVNGRARREDDPVELTKVSRDPSDEYLVALAVAVGADAVVTGDGDLLDLSDPPVPILSLRDFLGRLEASTTD